MGGLLKECGCFDGPHTPDDLTLVSVRCDEHKDEPAIEGYVPMRRNAAGHSIPLNPLAHVRRMAIPKTRKRKWPQR
jgi:hypothetical protein